MKLIFSKKVSYFSAYFQARSIFLCLRLQEMKIVFFWKRPKPDFQETTWLRRARFTCFLKNGIPVSAPTGNENRFYWKNALPSNFLEAQKSLTKNQNRSFRKRFSMDGVIPVNFHSVEGELFPMEKRRTLHLLFWCFIEATKYTIILDRISCHFFSLRAMNFSKFSIDRSDPKRLVFKKLPKPIYWQKSPKSIFFTLWWSLHGDPPKWQFCEIDDLIFLDFHFFTFIFHSFFLSSRVCSQLVSCTPLRYRAGWKGFWWLSPSKRYPDGGWAYNLLSSGAALPRVIDCLMAFCGARAAAAPPSGGETRGATRRGGPSGPGRVRRGNALRLAKNSKISSKILILVGHRFDSKKTCSAGFFGIESITLLEKLVEATSFFKKFQLR